MRRKDREVINEEKIEEILAECKVCRIAMQDEMGLYIVPLNYGYIYEAGFLTLYFHSANQGRKIDAMEKQAEVAFEMDGHHELVESEDACNFSYLYASIIGNGVVERIENEVEKEKALNRIMLHQSGRTFYIPKSSLKSVGVFRISVQQFTAKSHK